ncbi:MAG: PQQ-dependent sugar dehydrogenase [Maribacter sp.]|nr:PQQ-dependent sugar dehydrogenase [Maribacter sp.]
MSIPAKTIFISFVLCLLIFQTACHRVGKKETSQNTVVTNNNYLRDELSVQHGMALFNQHCASCHNFSSAEIGPNLSGVTSAVEKSWLVAFINNPTAVIQNGDERAVALFEKHHLYMPAFPMIQEKDLEDLLGFIHKFSEGEKKSKNTRKDGLLNPIPDQIKPSGLSLVVEEVVTVPPSATSGPKARINTLSALKTMNGERLFIADLRGKLYEMVANTVRVYLDIKEEEPSFIDQPGLGTGLGSFAFHPEFEHNGLFYTTHTEPAKTARADFSINDSIPVALQWVLTEWKAVDPAADTFSGVRRELIRVDMVNGIHGFQQLTFNPLARPGNPDYGLLYLGIGDGGAGLGGYPFLCNTNKTIWGSVLRIDPKGHNSANGKYGIPNDNPFIKEAGKVGEIWCRGFRNPHRISWDESGSGKMLISNIGQHSVEEINLGKKGADYGWPNREGTFLFDVEANTELVYPLPPYDSGYSYPVIQYDHDEGNAVSGGFVYAGSKIPALKGKYIFGDIPRGTLFYSEASELIDGQQAPIFSLGLELNGIATHFLEITPNDRVDLRFGVDSSGELFIFTKSNGKVYKVVGVRISVL